MTSFKKWMGTGLIALAVMASSGFTFAGMATPDSIIVMPARKRVVQLAFQLSRCKDVGLVTYNTTAGLDSPLIHVWTGQEWVQIGLNDYVQGSFMSGEPKHVFLLGDSNTLPLRMMNDVSWYKNPEHITTLDITSLVNTFGKSLKLSSRQWKWLAAENGLTIKDQNTERRRYGRWGSPGKEKEMNPSKLESIELPPSQIIIEPIAEPSEKAIPEKAETRKTEASKVETPKVEVPNVAPQKVATPIVEAPAVKVLPEVKPVEIPKTEAQKVETTKVEAPIVAVPPIKSKPEVKPVEIPVSPVVGK